MSAVTIIDGTIGNTILMTAIAVFIIAIAIGWTILILANWRKKADARQFYLDNVIAFKVGLIHKTAKDKEIDIVYRPKADLMNVLEEEVSKDLNTSP